MEKILNDDEKIRRAEEIYFRRNNQNLSVSNRVANKEKSSFKNKFFLNLLIMFNIAILVFAIQNKEYIFTQEFLGEIEQYNVNISLKITEFLKEKVSDEDQQNYNEKETQNISETPEIDQNIGEAEVPNENEVPTEIQPVTTEEAKQESTNLEELSSSLNGMDQDIQNLKIAYSFIKPIEPKVVSSGFGARESEYQKVTGYHTGIDLAADKGTSIKASMEGIVTLVSTEGDYGKHIKIRCNNVTTLYAHCSAMFVEEGQIVAQGQEIAAVGSTGNSTGPHLHFEIRVDDRYVDPAKILDF